jgi:hypothetical protein
MTHDQIHHAASIQTLELAIRQAYKQHVDLTYIAYLENFLSVEKQYLDEANAHVTRVDNQY